MLDVRTRYGFEAATSTNCQRARAPKQSKGEWTRLIACTLTHTRCHFCICPPLTHVQCPLVGVIIETTGTTDPASIARLLLADDIRYVIKMGIECVDDDGKPLHRPDEGSNVRNKFCTRILSRTHVLMVISTAASYQNVRSHRDICNIQFDFIPQLNTIPIPTPSDKHETAAAAEWRAHYALTATFALKSIVAVLDARQIRNEGDLLGTCQVHARNCINTH